MQKYCENRRFCTKRRMMNADEKANRVFPTENSLHSCLRRIRRKLEAIHTPCTMQNVRGVGYCFLQDDT